jgi:hypothetical protein
MHTTPILYQDEALMCDNPQSNRLSSTSGESHSGKISSLNGELSSLKEQKMAGEQRYRQDIEESGGTVPKSSDHSDASFMTGKPGGAGTLPGWETAKGALNRYDLFSNYWVMK